MTKSVNMAEHMSVPLSIPHLGGNEWKYVKECLDTGWVSSVGSYVNRFERNIADYINVPHAVAVSSGTAALHIALILSGVEPTDEVIVPTLTFIAPVNAVHYVGANPVFMDCDDFLNMDIDKTTEFCEKECEFDGRYLINRSSHAKVKAMIPVHIFGHPVDLDRLMNLAHRFNLKIIEDACESIGSSYCCGMSSGRKTGSIGHFGCFSFNGNKIITTGGGGVIATKDEGLANRAKYLTTQAKDDEGNFVHHEIGFNYRLTNMQAALGCAQLENLNSAIETKRANFENYRRCLANIKGLCLIEEPSYARSNYWFYTLKIDQETYGISARELKERLDGYGIQTRLLWELNHRQRPYESCQAYRIEKSIKFREICLNLPCSVGLSVDSIKRVSELIRSQSRV